MTPNEVCALAMCMAGGRTGDERIQLAMLTDISRDANTSSATRGAVEVVSLLEVMAENIDDDEFLEAVVALPPESRCTSAAARR
jgi:hypothetical protein